MTGVDFAVKPRRCSHSTPLFVAPRALRPAAVHVSSAEVAAPTQEWPHCAAGATRPADLRGVTVRSDTGLFISSHQQSTLQRHCDATAPESLKGPIFTVLSVIPDSRGAASPDWLSGNTELITRKEPI